MRASRSAISARRTAAREVTDNVALTGVADFNSYCITAPTDARLGSVSGQQLCGLYDVVPAKFGKVQNLVTLRDGCGPAHGSVSRGRSLGAGALSRPGPADRRRQHRTDGDRCVRHRHRAS